MLDRKVSIKVDSSTFPGGTAPTFLTNAADLKNSVSVASALLMLGTITVPGGYSSSSPARFWAWVRYLTALTSDPELCISAPFVDLDPHQRGILSDDFGVAITTQWLFNAFGGFANVVDGRRFVLQYASLLKPKHTAKLAKVGATKCPDFVLLDKNGDWHVLECKGTQSSASYMRGQLRTARTQKICIEIASPHKGYQLALGLYLGNQNNGKPSSMLVVDPDPDPVITIAPNKHRARDVMARLALSRAFAMAGAYEMADEVGLPETLVEDEAISQFYFEREKARFEIPREQRMASAMSSLRTQPKAKFEVGGRDYEGRAFDMDLQDPLLREQLGVSRIRVRQGASHEILTRARSLSGDAVERMEELASGETTVGLGGIQVEEIDKQVTIRDGDVAIATLEFLA